MANANQQFSAQVTGTVTNVDANDAINLRSMVLFNTTAAIAYLQIFETAAANVTLGTTVANCVMPLPVSGGVAMHFGEGWHLGTAGGTAGTRGLSIAGTTTRTGSTGAAIDVVLVY